MSKEHQRPLFVLSQSFRRASTKLTFLSFRAVSFTSFLDTMIKWYVLNFYTSIHAIPIQITPSHNRENMPFWDYIHFGRPEPDIPEEQRQYRNLQAGLMQIASQTCSILVQVNNTNNISYGNNATNVQYNNFSPMTDGPSGSCGSNRTWNGPSTSRASGSGRDSAVDEEQSVVLIPSTSLGIRGSTKNLFSHYKHRLSVSRLEWVNWFS